MKGRLRQRSNPPDMLAKCEEALPDVLQNILRVFLANMIAFMRRKCVVCANARGADSLLIS